MNRDILWVPWAGPGLEHLRLVQGDDLILADGLILASDGARSLYLVAPNPSEFKQLASAELFPEAAASSENDMASRVGGRNQNWAPMALADGKLLIRDQNQLKCVKVAK